MDKKWPFGFFVYSNIGDEEGTEPVTDVAVAEEAPVEEAETVEDVVEAAESEAVEEAPVEAAETIEEAIEEVVEEPAQTEESISSADEEDEEDDEEEEDDNEDQEDFLEEDEILDSKIVLSVEDLPTFDFSDVDLALEEDDFASEEESDERDENEDNDAFMDEEDADFPALEEELEIALEAAQKKQQKKNRLITGISAGVALLGVAGLATGLAIHSHFKKK